MKYMKFKSKTTNEYGEHLKVALTTFELGKHDFIEWDLQVRKAPMNYTWSHEKTAQNAHELLREAHLLANHHVAALEELCQSLLPCMVDGPR
jgi:hypothetical protein